jgi:hypothetical protein
MGMDWSRDYGGPRHNAGYFKGESMSIVGLVVLGVVLVAGFAVLNNGPIDKESRRRQAFWSKVEEDRP